MIIKKLNKYVTIQKICVTKKIEKNLVLILRKNNFASENWPNGNEECRKLKAKN